MGQFAFLSMFYEVNGNININLTLNQDNFKMVFSFSLFILHKKILNKYVSTLLSRNSVSIALFISLIFRIVRHLLINELLV